jgi:glutathione S-transferase
VARRNPKRQVPLLVDGDVSVYDSSVIEETQYPEPPGGRDLARLAVTRENQLS